MQVRRHRNGGYNAQRVHVRRALQLQSLYMRQDPDSRGSCQVMHVRPVMHVRHVCCMRVSVWAISLLIS